MSIPAGSFSTIVRMSISNVTQKDPIDATVYQTQISAVVYVTHFYFGNEKPTHHPINPGTSNITTIVTDTFFCF